MITMQWYNAKYALRPNWGHTVRLVESNTAGNGDTVDPDELEEIIIWAVHNSQARRISYDTWQFRSQEEANYFIMMYNLIWS